MPLLERATDPTQRAQRATVAVLTCALLAVGAVLGIREAPLVRPLRTPADYVIVSQRPIEQPATAAAVAQPGTTQQPRDAQQSSPQPQSGATGDTPDNGAAAADTGRPPSNVNDDDDEDDERETVAPGIRDEDDDDDDEREDEEDHAEEDDDHDAEDEDDSQ